MNDLGVCVLEVLLLPLAVLSAELEVGDNGVERDGLVVGVAGVRKGEVGAELEAAVTVVWGFLRGLRDEQEEENCYGYVYNDGNLAHFLFYSIYVTQRCVYIGCNLFPQQS